MRMTPAAAAVPLLLALLTWLSWRATNTDAELFDRALRALDDFVIAESALRRDILSTRAGLLHNYDPLVREVNALDESLGRLRDSVVADAEAAAIERLAASVRRQEYLVELFKSDIALSQNSLAYFGLFSTRLGGSDPNEPLAQAVSALAAAMLQLTLDTSPTAARGVEDRLGELARHPSAYSNADSVQALLAHGQMLHDLLPAMDGVLKALFAEPNTQEREAVRSVILAHQKASRATARRFRLLLYGTSLVLLGLLVHLGLRLQARSRALRRRAAFEHVIAGISTRFINAQPQEIDAHVEQALAQMAECVGADRSYFLVAGTPNRVHAWHRPGMIFPPSWPDQALALVGRFGPTAEGIVHIPNVDRLPAGTDRNTLAAAGLHGWTCVPKVNGDGARSVLGFDVLRGPCTMTRSSELGLLRMALDAVANAVERERLESERTRLEIRLQQARRMETVGALASGIAHNFNNIVGAILGYAEMAEAHLASDSRPARNLGEIRRAGERARDLVDQLLTFGRRRDARRRPMSVQALIAEAASLLHASLPATVELVIRDAPDVTIVSGESAQLQQVILNLCNNAAQAMDGVGRIEVDAEVHEIARARPLTHGELAQGRYARIAVSDTGRGMHDATLGRIFEPFFTTRLTGSGLGLATVREIVREHGGALNVWTTPGAGSRFEAWLPCVPASASAVDNDVPVLPLGRGEIVLVVDGDRERLLGAEDMLAALGYEPVGFTSANDALAACRATPERFDALVVVNLVPAMSALELAAALHKIVPGMPVLLATASADELGRHALVAANISEIVRRPLISTEIAAGLTRCLAIPRSSLGAS